MLEVNLKTRAASQTSVSFNSMCKFGDYFLGSSENGLSIIDGYNDNGLEIHAHIKSGTTDFGENNQKSFRFFYVSGESNGNCKISIYADGVLAGLSYIFPRMSGIFDVRVPVSREIRGRYWSWKFENAEGSFFTLYSVTALPVRLHSGRSRG